MTADEVCEALGTSPLGILRLLEQGKLRIDEDSVAEYIARRLPDPYALAAIDARAPRA